MIDVEQELREAFAARAGVGPVPLDLADRVIARGTLVRRRRRTAITATAMLAVALLMIVTLLPGVGHGPVPGPDVVATVPGELGVGKPVQVAVFSQYLLHLPDGSELEINSDPAENVTKVKRAAGAWVVWSIHKNRALPAVTMVRDDETTTSLGAAVVSTAISPDGGRIAVQSLGRDGQRLDVIAVPSGRPVAATPLAGEPDSAPVVTGWVGSLVVLSAPNGDSGPVATDVWDPARGPYRASMSGARLILGPAAEPGRLLALEPGRDLPDACLTWVDPIKAFTVVTRRCGAGLRFGAGPLWLSPDGVRLIRAGGPDVLDVRTMTANRLGLPEDVRPVAVGWEDPDTALFQLAGSVARCRLDTSPCELAPMPLVDGAQPLGFAG